MLEKSIKRYLRIFGLYFFFKGSFLKNIYFSLVKNEIVENCFFFIFYNFNNIIYYLKSVNF